MTSAPLTSGPRTRGAVALLVGYYAFVLGWAGAILALPVLIDAIPANGIFVCIVAALVVLWIFVPLPKRTPTGGVRVTREKHPRLFAEVELMAAATSQPMPDEVHLLLEANANVATRGGWLGFGARRVIGLGLPLLHRITVAELRAALTHEFGLMGHQRLRCGLRETRASLGRFVHKVDEHCRNETRVFFWPLLWYWRRFDARVRSLERAQTLAADRLAAQVAGTQPLIDVLRKLTQLEPALESYVRSEYEPIVARGRRPPLLDGFDGFLEQAGVRASLADRLRAEEQRERAEAHETHPPLGARIAALRGSDHPAPAVDARLASELVDDLEATELELLEESSPDTDFYATPPIAWAEVCETLLVPHWEDACRRHRAALVDVGVLDFARAAREIGPRSYRLEVDRTQTTREEELASVRLILDRALGLALRRQGWRLTTSRGGFVAAERGEERFEFQGTAGTLEQDPQADATWRATCARLQLRDGPLAPD